MVNTINTKSNVQNLSSTYAYLLQTAVNNKEQNVNDKSDNNDFRSIRNSVLQF